jgi:hypothetical protein
VKTISIIGRATTASFASCLPWRLRIWIPPRLVVVEVLVGWWSCSCAAAEDERKVHVAGEVQRDQGCRQAWGGAHGVVVILAMAWCR